MRHYIFTPRRILRQLSCVVFLAQTLLAIASPLAPAAAETPNDLGQPAPQIPNEVESEAVAVTDPTEIKKKLSELTIYGRYSDGEDWIEYHLTDGRTAYFEKGCTYPGKWWVESGEVCYAYPNYRDGTPNCFVMFVRPDGGIQFIAFEADNSPYLASSSIKIAPGNDAHLPLNGVSPCLSV